MSKQRKVQSNEEHPQEWNSNNQYIDSRTHKVDFHKDLKPESAKVLSSGVMLSLQDRTTGARKNVDINRVKAGVLLPVYRCPIRTCPRCFTRRDTVEKHFHAIHKEGAPAGMTWTDHPTLSTFSYGRRDPASILRRQWAGKSTESEQVDLEHPDSQQPRQAGSENNATVSANQGSQSLDVQLSNQRSTLGSGVSPQNSVHTSTTVPMHQFDSIHDYDSLRQDFLQRYDQAPPNVLTNPFTPSQNSSLGHNDNSDNNTHGVLQLHSGATWMAFSASFQNTSFPDITVPPVGDRNNWLHDVVRETSLPHWVPIDDRHFLNQPQQSLYHAYPSTLSLPHTVDQIELRDSPVPQDDYLLAQHEPRGFSVPQDDLSLSQHEPRELSVPQDDFNLSQHEQQSAHFEYLDGLAAEARAARSPPQIEQQASLFHSLDGATDQAHTVSSQNQVEQQVSDDNERYLGLNEIFTTRDARQLLKWCHRRKQNEENDGIHRTDSAFQILRYCYFARMRLLGLPVPSHYRGFD